MSEEGLAGGYRSSWVSTSDRPDTQVARTACKPAEHSPGDARGLEVSLGAFLWDQPIQRQIGDSRSQPQVFPLELLSRIAASRRYGIN